MASFAFPFGSPLGGDIAEANNPDVVDHVASAKARLIEQFKSQPNMVALVGIFAKQVQDLEAADIQLKTLNTIADSFGVQLDNLGKLLGETRGGFDDVTYRLHLQARVFLNKGSGTIPEILTMFAKILENTPGVVLQLEEQPPAAFALHTENSAALDTTLAPYMAKFLSQARGAGIRSIFQWTEVDPSQTFTFFDDPIGLGFDDGTFASAADS